MNLLHIFDNFYKLEDNMSLHRLPYKDDTI